MKSITKNSAINSVSASKRLLVFGTLLLAVISVAPSRAQDMPKTPSSEPNFEEHCIANLKRIHRLIAHYMHHTGGAVGFPSNFESIYLMAKDPKPFICPRDKQISTSIEKSVRSSYEVVNDPLSPKLSTIPANRIAIIAEKYPNHDGKRFVLFYDGSVRPFDKTQFDQLKNDSFVGLGSRP